MRRANIVREVKMDHKISPDYFQGFSKLDHSARIERLVAAGFVSQENSQWFYHPQLPELSLAEKFIENTLGYFPLPLGVVVNLCLNGRDYVVPMAVEETSIIAAASKTARWVRQHGELTAQNLGHYSIGQIQIAKVAQLEQLKTIVAEHQQSWISLANQEVAKGMVARGGGVKELQLRILKRPDGQSMAVIHVLTNTCDAMGANMINQVCEFLKKPIEQATGEQVTMCILSNLSDTRLCQAKIVLPQIESHIGEAIVEASLFAELDPYRAATSNKGVMNGIDPILIATGNDWRAVEAGLHAFVCFDGQYRSMTQWRMHQGDLVGTLTAPMMIGTVGGMTRLHPMAQICLNMLDVAGAEELAQVVVALGLIQNLGALRALTGEGIIRGHMKLHLDNVALSVGAQAHELWQLKQKLSDILERVGHITSDDALKALTQIRQHHRQDIHKN